MTATEQEVTRVWQQTLGLAVIGPDDDFFAVGGQSIQAIQAVAALQERLAVDLPMSLVFEAPTVREFAAEIDLARAARHPEPPGTGTDAPAERA